MEELGGECTSHPLLTDALLLTGCYGLSLALGGAADKYCNC
eukprot:SAG11_NODE_993_length_6261_cov_114.016391_8_plen_41_part_00